MKILKNRRFAATILLLCIGFSVVYGGYTSLKEINNNADLVFYYGEYWDLYDGNSIEGDLQNRLALAYNLITVAGRYQAANSSDIKSVRAACQNLENATSISEKAAANRELSTSTTALLYNLSTMQMSEKDENYLANIEVDLSAYNITIANSTYNAYVVAAHEDYEQFPAAIIAKLTGLRAPEYFR